MKDQEVSSFESNIKTICMGKFQALLSEKPQLYSVIVSGFPGHYKFLKFTH